MLSPVDFFDKFEQICNILFICSYLIKEICGEDFVSWAVSDIIPGDALVLVTKRTVEH